MWVYSLPAVNHPQNQNNFLMFSSSTLHVQYSSVDHSLITVGFSIYIADVLSSYMALEDPFSHTVMWPNCKYYYYLNLGT